MKVTNDDKVTTISSSFRNLGISNWIESTKDVMVAEGYTFPSFMTDIREQFLEHGWARKIHRSEIKRAMLPNQRFIDYANRVVYYNIILKGTEHHSDDKKLRETFIHHMSEGLINKVDTLPVDERTRIHEIVSLNTWMKEIENIDSTWKADLKSNAAMMNELLNRRQREEPRNNRTTDNYRNDPCNDKFLPSFQPSRNEPRDENRYHPYRRDNDRDCGRFYDSDRDRGRNYEF